MPAVALTTPMPATTAASAPLTKEPAVSADRPPTWNASRGASPAAPALPAPFVVVGALLGVACIGATAFVVLDACYCIPRRGASLVGLAAAELEGLRDGSEATAGKPA